jgi:hypothetical protein
MQSQVIALLALEGSPEAAQLVRRGDGQFSLNRIDARLGEAARLAATYLKGLPSSKQAVTPKR